MKTQLNELRYNYPEGIDSEAGCELFDDENIFKEVVKFAQLVLSENAIKSIFGNLSFSNYSKPKFIILLNMYLKSVNDKRRVSTAYQIWKNNYLFKDKYWVNSGLYFNGISKFPVFGTNQDEERNLYEQFKELDQSLVILNSDTGEFNIPIKIDLRGLILNKKGFIQLTKESVWAETFSYKQGDYKFQRVDYLGVNLKADTGFTHFVPMSVGLLRCFFGKSLNSGFGSVNDYGNNGKILLESA